MRCIEIIAKHDVVSSFSRLIETRDVLKFTVCIAVFSPKYRLIET